MLAVKKLPSGDIIVITNIVETKKKLYFLVIL